MTKGTRVEREEKLQDANKKLRAKNRKLVGGVWSGGGLGAEGGHTQGGTPRGAPQGGRKGDTPRGAPQGGHTKGGPSPWPRTLSVGM